MFLSQILQQFPLLFNFLMALSVIAGGIIYCIFNSRIRRADSRFVEKILGPPWGYFQNGTINEDNCIKIIAHRACGIDAPENSISALKKIIKKGIQAVEFDVMMTSDQIAVVFHDDSLDRMANDSRMVDDLSFEDLQSLDISVNHINGENYTGEKIPTFGAFTEHCLKNNISMLIDIKDSNLAEPIIEAFRRDPSFQEKALVSSFNPFVIYKIRLANPNITGCLAWRPYYYSYQEYNKESGPKRPFSANPILHLFHRLQDLLHGWLLNNFIYYILGLSALLLHKDMITRDVLEYWKKRNIRVLAWTVNLPEDKEFCEKFLQIPYLTDTCC